MQIIDTHVNITPKGKWINPKFIASIGILEKKMKKADVKKAILISLPGYGSNEHIAKIVNSNQSKFKGLGYINLKKDNINTQIDTILESGLSGIKFNPRVQKTNITKEEYEPMWEHLNKRKSIVLIDGYFQLISRELLISEIQPFSYERIINKYSNITFILAHSGFHKIMDTFFLCRSYSNFYANLSFSLDMIKETSFYKDYKFFVKMCDQKILFGSDFPELSIKSSIKKLKKLTKELDTKKKENIFYKNAEKIFWK